MYRVAHSFKKENSFCHYWWQHANLLYCRSAVTCLRVSVTQVTSMQVRLNKKEVGASSRLEFCCSLILWAILCMCSVGFPGTLFCTLQNKPQPGISVFKKEKKSRNEFTDCKLLWVFFKYIFYLWSAKFGVCHACWLICKIWNSIGLQNNLWRWPRYYGPMKDKGCFIFISFTVSW